MKVVLTGGGTIGAVSPLLAVREVWRQKNPQMDFIWIGTEGGIEKEIVEKDCVPFYPIKSAKLRRYFSWETFLDPLRFIVGFVQAWKLLNKFKPEFIMTCGGYVSVPVVLAGYLKKIKIIVHQQDLEVGLANRIMALFATKITVSFKPLLKEFNEKKTVLTGNPVRQRLFAGNKNSAEKRFDLRPGKPVLFVLGGSLGSAWINETVYSGVSELTEFCDVLHVTGKINIAKKIRASGYHQFEFLHEELADAFAAADLVVARAGLSTMSELAALGKAAVIVPIPHNQQERNIEYFAEKGAAVYLRQNTTSPAEFVALMRYLLENKTKRLDLQAKIKEMMPADAADKMVKMLRDIR
jgi:UDP-N-acetylglucosamine--N-acetylmuramyl-(pentapeptide) pyrophosphoryl-undecaprenol N-acetylglucosamine transferase